MVTDTESREVLLGPDPPESKSHAAQKRWQTIWPLNALLGCLQPFQRKASYDPPTHVRNHLADRQPPTVYVCDGQTGDGQIIEAETSLTVLLDRHIGRENAETALDESMSGHPTSDALSSPSTVNGLRGKRRLVNLGEEPHPVAAVVESGAPFGKLEQGSAASNSTVEESGSSPKEEERRWLVPWYWQCLVLSHRAIKQSRPLILSKLNFLQVCGPLHQALAWQVKVLSNLDVSIQTPLL